MKRNAHELLSKIMLCVLAALIPLLLIAYGFQTRRYAELAREISELERRQEELIEQNKKLVGDISLLSSSERIETIASEELGMHKARSEDIVRVEMDGAKK
ncbi:MAG: septum formation initiator family protein [Treponemataceae bacterium]|nr:septum formation initiator family protein [Treponemataceae bacterium]